MGDREDTGVFYMMARNKSEIMRMTNAIVGALDYGSDDLFTSAVITSILTGIPFSEEEIRLLVEQEGRGMSDMFEGIERGLEEALAYEKGEIELKTSFRSNDLISREALMKFPIRIEHYDKENGNLDFVLGIESVLEYAESLPTVDAVEVKQIKAYLQSKLDEWNALGDRKFEPANMWGYNFIMACFDDLARMDGESNE